MLLFFGLPFAMPLALLLLACFFFACADVFARLRKMRFVCFLLFAFLLLLFCYCFFCFFFFVCTFATLLRTDLFLCLFALLFFFFFCFCDNFFGASCQLCDEFYCDLLPFFASAER
jgi:hypothetical protein